MDDDFSEFNNPIVEKPKTPIVKSALKGGIQGSTFGFGDEASAAIDTGISKIPGVRSIAEYLNSLAGGHPGTSSLSDPNKTYAQRRDEYRDLNTQAAKDNPLTYLGGEIGGSLITPGPKGSSLIKRAASVAGQGAASGLGHSEAHTLEGVAKDTAIGGGIGLGAGLAGEGIRKVGSKISEKAGDIIKADKALEEGKILVDKAQKLAKMLDTAEQTVKQNIEKLANAKKFNLSSQDIENAQNKLNIAKQLQNRYLKEAKETIPLVDKTIKVAESPKIVTGVKEGLKNLTNQVLPTASVGAAVGGLTGDSDQSILDRVIGAGKGAVIGTGAALALKPVKSIADKLVDKIPFTKIASGAKALAGPADAVVRNAEKIPVPVAKSVTPGIWTIDDDKDEDFSMFDNSAK